MSLYQLHTLFTKLLNILLHIYFFLLNSSVIFPKVIPVYQLNKAPAFSWKYSIHISAEINADLQANLSVGFKNKFSTLISCLANRKIYDSQLERASARSTNPTQTPTLLLLYFL